MAHLDWAHCLAVAFRRRSQRARLLASACLPGGSLRARRRIDDGRNRSVHRHCDFRHQLSLSGYPHTGSATCRTHAGQRLSASCGIEAGTLGFTDESEPLKT